MPGTLPPFEPVLLAGGPEATGDLHSSLRQSSSMSIRIQIFYRSAFTHRWLQRLAPLWQWSGTTTKAFIAFAAPPLSYLKIILVDCRKIWHAQQRLFFLLATTDPQNKSWSSWRITESLTESFSKCAFEISQELPLTAR